jgi:hypothetical protein
MPHCREPPIGASKRHSLQRNIYQFLPSLDWLTCKRRKRDGKARRFAGHEVDHQLEFGRLPPGVVDAKPCGRADGSIDRLGRNPL